MPVRFGDTLLSRACHDPDVLAPAVLASGFECALHRAVERNDVFARSTAVPWQPVESDPAVYSESKVGVLTNAEKAAVSAQILQDGPTNMS